MPAEPSVNSKEGGHFLPRFKAVRNPDSVPKPRRLERSGNVLYFRDRVAARDVGGGRGLRRALRIDDDDLLSKIYEQHKQVETADGRVDAQLMTDTIRDARQTEGITKEIPVNQVFDFSYLATR